MNSRHLLAITTCCILYPALAFGQTVCGSWELRDNLTLPTARVHMGIAFDALRQNSIVFGGEVGGQGPGSELADT